MKSILTGCLLAVICGMTTEAATIKWTNTDGGNWSVPANWDLNRVPGSDDDVVVSNAGIASAAAIEDTSLALWNHNVEILGTGYFLTSRAAFRLLKRQGIGGSIIFIVSKNGLAASPGASAWIVAGVS